jgi:predicted nuclease of predicted toxin-antitoxin system
MAIRFKLDENIPRNAEFLLAGMGHDVDTVRDEHLVGQTDDRVLACCIEEKRVLVTLDLDFSDIRAYPPGSHAGIWVLRPDTQDAVQVVELLKGALTLLDRERPEQGLWVVERGRVRIKHQ